MNGAAFPEREFPRRCAMCNFVADPGYPWDEKLAPLAYCPHCAVPLERIACQACGAPPVIQVGYSMFGGQVTGIAPNCGHCGEPITRREPQRRQKPAAATPATVPTERVGRLDFFDKLFAVDKNVTLGAMYGNLSAKHQLNQRAADRQRACAYKKADPACRCPACKAVRRHLRKKGS